MKFTGLSNSVFSNLVMSLGLEGLVVTDSIMKCCPIRWPSCPTNGGEWGGRRRGEGRRRRQVMAIEAALQECLLTRLAAAEPLSDDEGAVDEVADGGPGGLALAARGSGDGTIACVDARPPVGSEAVGDLAEDHGRADFLLTDVVKGHAVSGAFLGRAALW